MAEQFDSRKISVLPHVLSVNISPGGIPKLPVDSVWIVSDGLKGDGHNHEKHRTPLQAVCLQDIETLEELQSDGFELDCGEIGENITVKNLFINQLPVGTILEFSGGVVIEMTKVRKPCYVLDQIDPRLKDLLMGRCGIYAKVLKEGLLQKGETIRVQMHSA